MDNERVTFKQIEDCFDSFLLLEDRNVVRLMLSVVIGNQMGGRRPIWLMLVAPSSSGKTTLLNSLNGMELINKNGDKIHPIQEISEITESSFASGMRRSDKETSLLFRIPHGGLLLFKDFTSMLSQHKEVQTKLMSQLREIYDGKYTKRFGNGEDIEWAGKIGAIAGVTEAIYRHLESMSVMGDRFIFYQPHQPDRREALVFKLEQEERGTTEYVQTPIVQGMVQQYVQQALDGIDDHALVLDKKTRDEVIEVADFCTLARSGLFTNNYTGEIVFTPTPEMPMRMFEQMLAIASALRYMRVMEGDISGPTQSIPQDDFNLIYKVAYDSIPVVRRTALRHLAQHTEGVDTAALAMKINYPTKVVAGWLEELTALGVVQRVKRSGFGNWWKLRPQYQKIVLKLQGVKVLSDYLTQEDAEAGGPEVEWERDKKLERYTDPHTLKEMEENDSW
jgi:energy-coupling factor transporter ATP-binding protein EcfA2